MPPTGRGEEMNGSRSGLPATRTREPGARTNPPNPRRRIHIRWTITPHTAEALPRRACTGPHSALHRAKKPSSGLTWPRFIRDASVCIATCDRFRRAPECVEGRCRALRRRVRAPNVQPKQGRMKRRVVVYERLQAGASRSRVARTRSRRPRWLLDPSGHLPPGNKSSPARRRLGRLSPDSA